MARTIVVRMNFRIQKDTLWMNGTAGPGVSSGKQFGFVCPLPPIHRQTVEEEIQTQKGRHMAWLRNFYNRPVVAEVRIVDERCLQTDLNTWGAKP